MWRNSSTKRRGAVDYDDDANDDFDGIPEEMRDFIVDDEGNDEEEEQPERSE